MSNYLVISSSSSDDDAPPPKRQRRGSVLTTNVTRAIDSFEIGEASIHSTMTSRIANRFDMITARFPVCPKTTTRLDGRNYSTYPDYSRDDLVPVCMPGDPADLASSALDSRFMVGSAWKDMSCAIDSFLWISQVCNIRRIRCDVITNQTHFGRLDKLSQLVYRYLRLPLGAISQAQRDGFRDSISSLVREDDRMNYISNQGMDVRNLFVYAWGQVAVPLHQVSFTQIRFRNCRGCSDYNLDRHTDRLNISMQSDQSLTLEQALQAYFDPQLQTQIQKCPHCNGKPMEQRIILDRMPQLLLWLDGCTRTGKAVSQYLDTIHVDVEISEEEHLNSDIMWEPRRTRITYKPAAVVIRDAVSYGPNCAHWYAASCLPFTNSKEARTSDEWLVYDGQGPRRGDRRLVINCKGAKLMSDIAKKGHEVSVAILEKIGEEVLPDTHDGHL